MTALRFGRRPAGLLACVSLVLCFAATPAARAQPLADKVPADAILYVGWLGYDAKGPGYQGSHLQAVAEAAQVQQLFDETFPRLLQKLAEKDRKAAEGLGIAKPILMPMLKHPSAIWVGTPELGAGKEPKPRAGLMSQAGPDADAMLQHIQNLLQNAPPQVTDLVKVSKAGDTVVVGIGYAEGQVPAAAGKGLAGSASFAAVKPHMVPNASFAVFADVGQLVATVDKGVDAYAEPDVKDHWPKIRDAVGVGGVKHFVWSTGFDGKDWLDHVFLHAPEPRKGLVALADPTPLSDASLKLIPATATRAGAVKFDLSKFVAGIRKAVGDVEPQATEQIDRAFAEVSKQIGLNVQKDVLDLFGDEWAYYTDPMTGGRGLGGIVLVNRLRDPSKGEAALSKIERLVNDALAKNIKEKDVSVRFLTTKSGNTTIHYLGTPILSPSWAVKDGYVIVGLFPQVVAGAVEQIGTSGKSILDNPGFQAVRKRLAPSGGGVNAVAFADLPQTAPDAYATWAAISRLSGFADVFGVPAPAMLLPPLGKLMPHLAPAGQVTWTDKDGIHTKAISPFPGAQLLASDPLGGGQATPLMVSVLLPALSKARENANRVKSASNLRQIGQAAFIVSNDNARGGGKFPASVRELVDKSDLSAGTFVNPRRSDAPAIPPGLSGTAVGRWVEENSHYAYVGAGLTNAAGPDVILGYEKPEGLTEGINVLFADGHVEWLFMADAMGRIDQQQQKRPAAVPGAAPGPRGPSGR